MSIPSIDTLPYFANTCCCRYRESILLSQSNWLDMRTTIRSDITAVAETLPTIARSVASEERLVGQLNLLSGYLTLIGSDSGGSSLSISQQQHLMKQLCAVLQFDEVVNVQVLESSTVHKATTSTETSDTPSVSATIVSAHIVNLCAVMI
jgi:hypothetical protein